MDIAFGGGHINDDNEDKITKFKFKVKKNVMMRLVNMS